MLVRRRSPPEMPRKKTLPILVCCTRLKPSSSMTSSTCSRHAQ